MRDPAVASAASLASGDDVSDVVVVGAGPAGAVAALVLARAGARVALLEKEPLPRPKTCGGGVVGRAWRWLPEGAVPASERACHTAELHCAETGLRFAVERGEPIVRTSMRADFDASLVAAAAAAGARVVAPCRVEGMRVEPDAVRIATTRGTYRGRAVIGADGVQSTVARTAGWEAPLACIPALECELDIDAGTLARFAAAVRFDFGVVPGGYAWLFPKRAHLTLGVLALARRGPAHLRAWADAYRRHLGLGAVAPRSVRGALVPVRPRSGGWGRGPVLLAGDAAGAVDVLTAEGIGYAVGSGRLAAEALLAADLDPVRAGALYEASVRRHILPELAWGRRLAAVLYGKPRWRRALFRHAGARLCEAMVEVMLGHRTYTELLGSPPAGLRLLRELGGRRPPQAPISSPRAAR